MSLIDVTYFDNPEVMIPTGSYDNRASFITRYEPKLLEELFGYELAKEIMTYDVGTSSQRIKDIVEGKEFTVSDVLYKWVGLKNDDKVSIIAYYVYYWWLRQSSSTTTPNSEIKVINENSENVVSVQKITSAWSEYEHQQDLLIAFMFENESTYPEWQYSRLGNINAFDL